MADDLLEEIADEGIDQWREALPDGCPLPDATPLEDITLVRLIGPDDLNQGDFHSYAALGYECVQPEKACEWSACSMFVTSVPQSFLVGLRRFKRLRNKNAVAWVKVGPHAGTGLRRDDHVSVWMRKSFDPVAAVTKQSSLDDYEPT